MKALNACTYVQYAGSIPSKLWAPGQAFHQHMPHPGESKQPVFLARMFVCVCVCVCVFVCVSLCTCACVCACVSFECIRLSKCTETTACKPSGGEGGEKWTFSLWLGHSSHLPCLLVGIESCCCRLEAPYPKLLIQARKEGGAWPNRVMHAKRIELGSTKGKAVQTRWCAGDAHEDRQGWQSLIWSTAEVKPRGWGCKLGGRRLANNENSTCKGTNGGLEARKAIRSY